ncbi:SAGA-associated factor 11 homolog [Anthonomus grandis grandis]|uniref:SAGA-associated factor 11 homolog n=1 Tax=Anthonomus grandis grandis TaxID=2921223 RepID=UPI002165C1DF|nr:SAGA-associated factor 11 homolog [Anthonomus grandis grandis]
MSKRQLLQQQQQQPALNDLNLEDLVDREEDPGLFDHLEQDFKDLLSNKQVLQNSVEKFLNNLFDEITLGLIFDLHRKYKTRAYGPVTENGDDDDEHKQIVFPTHNPVKNNQKCICPNCEKIVAPLRFARHLAQCMGVSDTSRPSRHATRRAATNKDKGDPSAYAGVPSDDDDDEDWNSRRNNKKKDKNGGKKNRGTPKKNAEQEVVDPINVDVEGGFDEVPNLRYMIDQDRRSYSSDLHEARSSSSSPVEGVGCLTPPKRRDKSKKKKRKERGSPGTSLSFD